MVGKSKRFLSFLCALIVLVSSYAGYVLPLQVNAAETSPVLDLENDVKWFGRTYADNGTHNFSWSNSGFQFTFYGTGATATLAATQNVAGDATQTAYVKIYVDDVHLKDIAVPEATTEVTLASGLEKGVHTIKVIKRTSGYYSTIAVSQIQLDAGSEIRTTQKYYEKNILFLGDSFTTGLGSMATSSTATGGTAIEDSTLAYTALTADYFGAENMTIALPARGISYNGKPSSTTHRAGILFEYHDYFSRSKNNLGVYDHTQYNPDLIVINFGNFDEVAAANSSSTGGTTIDATEIAAFKSACKDFIVQVRTTYPEAKILYTYGINKVAFKATIKEAVAELNGAGYSDIYFAELPQSTGGVDGLPTTSGHATISNTLIKAVKDITGWEGKDETKNPVSSDFKVEALYEPFEQTDITVMSYNVLRHSGDEDEAWSARQPKVVKLAKAYNPDIIGFQEAAGPYDSYTHDWPGYLSSNLTEYTAIRLRNQTGGSASHAGNGLMLMFKKDRFTKLADGCVNMKSTVTVDSITDTDNDRWFQWVKLQDNQTGTVFYFYNTHLSVDPTNSGYTSAQKKAIGDKHRTNECTQLAQHVASTNAATKCPFFITGDFNASFSVSNTYESTDPTRETLNKLINYSGNDFFRDAATIADFARFSDYLGDIDHVFVNNRYVDVKEYHVAYENVDGRRTSDHAPNIAYCNFKGNATINGIDTAEREIKVETSSNTYNFTFDVGTNVKCEIYDAATGSLLATKTADGSQSVTLAKGVNRFGIKFYDGNGNPTCTITAIITNTSVAKPTITATGSVVNQYFANGAYHILVNGATLDLATSDGNFYTNPYASRKETATLALTEIKAGRTVYYLKTAAGDIYPVYIYAETSAANSSSSVLYVEDDTNGATGTVAFYDGKDVFFAEAGTKIFGTVEAVAAKANTINDAIVYFAPGKYDSNEVKFTKNVTLLGNNYDVLPIAVKTPNWEKAGRKAETIINGGFVFESASDISVTIKGFTLEGKTTNGPIYITDTTSADSTRAAHVQTLDIQNNIITGSGNGSSGTYPATIHAYSGAQIKGTIKHNYFRSTNNQFANGDSGHTRGLRVKNANGLVIDTNYFIGYEFTGYFTDEISSSVAGNANYTVIGNRLELCGTFKNFIKGITSESIANVAYLHNDFVRSGGSGLAANYTIHFNFNQSELGNDFSRVNIDIIGNRFADCFRAIQFTRSLKEAQTGNLAEANVRVNKNSFINPTEGAWKKYFRSIDLSFGVVGANLNMEIPADKWNFAENHFESTFLVTELAKLQESGYYRDDIYEMNYIRHYGSESLAAGNESFLIGTAHFTKLTTPTASSAAEAFKGVTGSNNTGYEYNFDSDPANAKLTKGGVSPFRENFTFNAATSTSYIAVTKDSTARVEGFAQFYSDNRWTGENEISVDLKMESLSNDFAGFFIKYGKENRTSYSDSSVFFSNDGARADSSSSTTGTTGIGFSLRTVSGVQCVEVFVKYLNSSGKIAVSGQYFYNVVENHEEFNTYKVHDDGAGTIKFYANDNLFATLVCTDAKVPTLNTAYTETYYSNVQIQDKNGATLATVSNALVSTESALAFGSRNEIFEIDNVVIIGGMVEPEEKPYELGFDGVQLTLSDAINMRFGVNKEIFEAEGYSNPVVKAEFAGKTYELQATITTIGGISYYTFVFENIYPHMMNDTVYATLSAEINGEVVQGKTAEASVAKYAYSQLERTTDATLRTLLVDMLRYGSYAQSYVGHNTVNLADANLTTEQAAWGTQALRELVSTASSPNFNGDAKWLGMGLQLGNKVNIMGYFNAPITEGMYVQVTDANNNVIRKIQQSEFRAEAGTVGKTTYSFVFDKLTAKQMSNTVGFTVYNAQGENISGTILYSVESYVQRNQGTTDTNLLNLMNAMMKYGDAARAYAG